VLYAHSQFLCSSARFDLGNRGVCQQVQLHTFYAPLLVFDKTLAQPDFAVVNCSDVVMSWVSLPCFNAQPDIFAVMKCCVAALSLFSSDILTWSADSYIQCNETKIKCSGCRRTCILCQQTSPKCWFENINVTSQSHKTWMSQTAAKYCCNILS